MYYMNSGVNGYRILKNLLPRVTTKVPGPKSLALKASLSDNIDARNIAFFTDLDASHGNYVADADSNLMLDMLCNIASLPVGYNHPRLIETFKNQSVQNCIVQRPALGMLPPKETPGLISKFAELYRPRGLDFLYCGSACGSTAVENAMKATFVKYSRYHMNQSHDNELMLKSALYNFKPGCPSLDILSFKSGFHGRTLKTLELCSSKAEHKLY